MAEEIIITAAESEETAITAPAEAVEITETAEIQAEAETAEIQTEAETAETAEIPAETAQAAEIPAAETAEDSPAAPEEEAGKEDDFPPEFDPHFAYRKLIKYAERIHRGCKRVIRGGYISLLVLPAFLAVMLKLTNSDKVVFLVIWIICMFALAALLIFTAFFDHQLQKLIDDVHASEKFGSLMSPERSAHLAALNRLHHHSLIWHIKEEKGAQNDEEA